MNINQILSTLNRIKNRTSKLEHRFQIEIIIGNNGEYQINAPLFEVLADKSQYKSKIYDRHSYDLIDKLAFTIKNLEYPILASELLDLGEFLGFDSKRMARLMDECKHIAEVS